MDIKVSLVVPIYNAEKYLEKCICSIQNQTFEDFELILINDGSTDGSESICRKYQMLDSRIQYVSQKNAGVSIARNVGLDMAAGEFVSFVDADDWLQPDYLEILIAKQAENDADLTVCEFTNIDEVSGKGSRKSVFNGDYCGVKEEIYDTVLEKILWNHQGQRLCNPYCKLYRRQLISEYGIYFEENVPLGEDTLFNITYLQYVNFFCYVRVSLYNRLLHETSAMHMYRPNICQELISFWTAYVDLRQRIGWKCRAESHFIIRVLISNPIIFYFAHNDGAQYFKQENEKAKEFYDYLFVPPVLDVWRQIRITDCKNIKELLNVFCVKAHLFGFLLLIYRIFRHKSA